jgi:hypothetical protein
MTIKNIVDKYIGEAKADKVEWYVDKFKMKMKGHKLDVAEDWVRGIGDAVTADEMDKIWQRIQKEVYKVKKPTSIK